MHTSLQIISWLTPLIDAVRIANTSTPHICCWGGLVCLRSLHHTAIPHPEIHAFTSLDMKAGLKTTDWELIAYKVTKHLKEHQSCRLCQKPSQTPTSNFFEGVVTALGFDPSSPFSAIPGSASEN